MLSLSNLEHEQARPVKEFLAKKFMHGAVNVGDCVGTEGNGPPTGVDRRRPDRNLKTTMVLVVLVAVIVVLSGASVSYWSLSKHYYDAKYRAQYEAVSSLLSLAEDASGAIERMVEPGRSANDRLAIAVGAYHALDAAYATSEIVRVMYPSDSKESSAFSSLGLAVANVETAVGEYLLDLDYSLVHNVSYIPSAGVNSSFVAISIMTTELFGLVSAGIDHDRDSYEDPYSLVKRMDLVTIGQKSHDLFDAANNTLQLIAEGGPVIAG